MLREAARDPEGRAYFGTVHQDRTARDLAGEGLGEFANFRSHYSWRKRDGYVNHFRINDKGRALLAQRDKRYA